MSSFDGSPTTSSPRRDPSRSLTRSTGPRLGIAVTPVAPGLGVVQPRSQGAQLAQQTLQALGSIGQIAGQIGSAARAERSEIFRERAEERRIAAEQRAEKRFTAAEARREQNMIDKQEVGAMSIEADRLLPDLLRKAENGELLPADGQDMDEFVFDIIAQYLDPSIGEAGQRAFRLKMVGPLTRAIVKAETKIRDKHRAAVRLLIIGGAAAETETKNLEGYIQAYMDADPQNARNNPVSARIEAVNNVIGAAFMHASREGLGQVHKANKNKLEMELPSNPSLQPLLDEGIRVFDDKVLRDKRERGRSRLVELQDVIRRTGAERGNELLSKKSYSRFEPKARLIAEELEVPLGEVMKTALGPTVKLAATEGNRAMFEASSAALEPFAPGLVATQKVIAVRNHRNRYISLQEAVFINNPRRRDEIVTEYTRRLGLDTRDPLAWDGMSAQQFFSSLGRMAIDESNKNDLTSQMELLEDYRQILTEQFKKKQAGQATGAPPQILTGQSMVPASIMSLAQNGDIEGSFSEDGTNFVLTRINNHAAVALDAHIIGEWHPEISDWYHKTMTFGSVDQVQGAIKLSVAAYNQKPELANTLITRGSNSTSGLRGQLGLDRFLAERTVSEPDDDLLLRLAREVSTVKLINLERKAIMDRLWGDADAREIDITIKGKMVKYMTSDFNPWMFDPNNSDLAITATAVKNVKELAIKYFRMEMSKPFPVSDEEAKTRALGFAYRDFFDRNPWMDWGGNRILLNEGAPKVQDLDLYMEALILENEAKTGLSLRSARTDYRVVWLADEQVFSLQRLGTVNDIRQDIKMAFVGQEELDERMGDLLRKHHKATPMIDARNMMWAHRKIRLRMQNDPEFKKKVEDLRAGELAADANPKSRTRIGDPGSRVTQWYMSGLSKQARNLSNVVGGSTGSFDEEALSLLGLAIMDPEAADEYVELHYGVGRGSFKGRLNRFLQRMTTLYAGGASINDERVKRKSKAFKRMLIDSIGLQMP